MKIAVLGLGIIGSAWAKNLIADGHKVKCWNRTPKEFPGFCLSPQEAVEGADAIFIVVSDPEAVQAVLDQIQPHLNSKMLVIQSSTISSKWTKLFASQIEKSGALFLEAPFTGSKEAAELRKTVFYLGGEPEVMEKARPMLEPISSAILPIGPLGSASTLKLAMNLNIAGVAQALSESLTLCRAAEIPDEVYFEALKRNVSRSGIVDMKEPKLRQADYAPQFSLKNMDKDLRLALETAEDLETPLEHTKHLKKIYDKGMKKNFGEDDFIGLLRVDI